MITADNILSHEFIGQTSEIVKSSNKQIIGLNGTIVDETKSMFAINTSKGRKLIPKGICYWKFQVNDHQTIVDGSKIEKRSFERIGVKA